MAVLFEGTSGGVYGTVYTVQVTDTEYASTAVDVSLGAEGFVLSYKPEEEEQPHAPIVSSECTFSIVRTPDNNSTVSTFVSDLIGADEGRFRVKILDASGNLYWCGYILADQIVEQDRGWADTNSLFTIRAKDGINRLKNIDYNNDGTAYTGRETLLQHLFKILGKIDTADFFGTSDEYFQSIVKWYEADMDGPTLSTDPLSLTYFDHQVAITRDRAGTNSYRSAYEILKSICTIMGARFYFSAGSYRFDQIGEYKNGDGSLYRHRYRKAGTKIGTESSIDLRKSETDDDFIRASEGQYSYFAPIRRAEITFKHRNDYNYLEGQTWDELNVSDFEAGSVGTQNIALRIAGTLEVGTDFDANFQQIRNVMGIKVKATIGGTDYYLSRGYNVNVGGVTYNQGEWTTNSASRMYVVCPIQTVDNTRVTTNVDYISPNLPTDAEIAIIFVSVNYSTTLLVSTQDTSIQVLTTTWDYFDSILQLYSDTDAALTEETLSVLTNPDNTGLSEVLEMETLIADSPDLLTSAAFTVINSSSDVVPAEEWTVGTSGTGRLIQRLLLAEIMKIRKKALLRWRGSIIDTGDYAYHNIMWLTTGNEFIPITASYFAYEERWEGEWVNTDYEIIDIADFVQERYIGGPPPPPPLPGFGENGPVLDWDTAIEPVGGSFTNGGQIGTTTDGPIIEGETITSIPIVQTGVEGLIQSGDTIKLVTSGGVNASFVVDADLGPTDTSISVQSQVAGSTFGAGSYVAVSTDTYVSNVQSSTSVSGKVTRYRQVFENAGATVTVTENGGTLPASTEYIDVHYNGRLLAEGASLDYQVSGSDINFTFTPRGGPRVVVTFWIID